MEHLDFNRKIWVSQIDERLFGFARSPWRDVQISGATTMLSYLVKRTIEPFIDALERVPISAIRTLTEITDEPGANYIVLHARKIRYRPTYRLERELHRRQDLCAAVEDLMIALNTIHMARQRLNNQRDDWLRSTLLKELEAYKTGVFSELRPLLHDDRSKSLYEIICDMRQREGHFTPADLILLNEALEDSRASVRAEAARRLGELRGTPAEPMISKLVRVALFDRDLRVRNTTARALGALRDRLTSLDMLDELAEQLLSKDNFVRSAAAQVLGELGEIAGQSKIIEKLVPILLKDEDTFVRTAAACALSNLGLAAATPEVMNALMQAGQNDDEQVHIAAVNSLLQLRELRDKNGR